MHRLTLVLLPLATRSHITTICTATSPTVAGKVTFFFGTYHAITEGADVEGTVRILKPDGTTMSGGFSDYCGASNNAVTSAQDGNPACPGPELKTHCATSVVPTDSHITCCASAASQTNSAGGLHRYPSLCSPAYQRLPSACRQGRRAWYVRGRHTDHVCSRGHVRGLH